MLQLNRLLAHFPRHGTDEDWQVLVHDYVSSLEEFSMDKIELAVWQHIREGDFFPKLSELVARCKPKFRTDAPKDKFEELPWYGPDLETRQAGVAAWEQSKQRMTQNEDRTKTLSELTEAEAKARLEELKAPTLTGEELAARQRRVQELLKTPHMQSKA